MSELFSIQLQNRQQQGGDGVWLDLPTTTEQVQVALRQIGISSDNPQGLFISGYFAEEEKRFAISYNMVLASNVDELNFLASRLETLSTGERAELNAALQAPQSELFSIGRITDFPENVDYYVHLPDVHGPAQLGDYYLNRSGMVNMPEEWKGGIDTAQFGRYVAQQEQGAFTQYGYLVKSGDEWQKVHEGQPVPEEYRVLSFPAPEVLRDSANIPPPVQPETEPQKVIPIILNGKDSAERMKEITDRLETGIQELFDSDRYKAYLTTMAKFHNYSFNNTLLIAMQGGQLVAGFNKWKDTFHRTVKKGEKGIKILAPAPYKVKQKMEKLDEQGKPILDKDGKPLTEEKTVQIPAFKVVSVFDVSQTEGEPLPSIAVDELSGSVQDYQDFFKALEQASPVPIGFEDIEGGAHGYFHLLDNRIAIQEGMSQLQTIKTAIHEQNAFPGVTNKLLAKEVNIVLAASADAVEKLGAPEKTTVVGNPVRPEVLTADRAAARAKLNAGNRTVILSFGGSLGADRINQVVADLCAWEKQTHRNVLHLHATGSRGVKLFEGLEKEKGFAPGENLVVTEYINNMPQLLAAADLVIARSGALTLAELEAVGRASVLIPSPNVAENHQYYNALELQKAGAAVVIEEKNLTGDGLVKTVETLLASPGKLAEMGANAKTLGNPHSLDLITEKLLKLVKG